jgi:hypothetical protein
LNNNPHKFDEHGNFDPAPDERDYWPFLFGSKYGNAPKTNKRGRAGLYPAGKGPDDIAQDRNGYALDDFEKGIRYDHQKCNDNWELEKKLCRDGNYSSGCWTRANDRNNKCERLGHYDGLPIWTYAEEVGSPPELDKRRKKKSGQDPKPQPQPNPKPKKKPDKSEFSVGSMFTNALTDTLTNTAKVALALNPGLQFAVDPSGTQSRMNSILRNFVMLPSDYPEGMRPLSKWSPTPATSAAFSILPVPFGGAATLRIPTPPGR